MLTPKMPPTDTMADLIPVSDVLRSTAGDYTLLTDGTYAVHLRVQPQDMTLKDAGGVTANFDAFQAAYNSLTVGVRIYIGPRAADLEEQMNHLRSLMERAATSGRRTLIADQIEFVADLMSTGNAAERDFFFILTTPPAATEAQRNDLFTEVRNFIATLGTRGISASWMSAADVINTFVRFSLPSPAVTLPSDDPSLNIAPLVGD
ncbi:MAG: hypothetical protein ACYC2X_04245 [Coriobacteriia bacterium]